jgi:hypothetical protein
VEEEQKVMQNDRSAKLPTESEEQRFNRQAFIP